MVDFKKLYKVSRYKMGNWALEAKNVKRNYAQIPFRSDEDMQNHEGLLQL